MKSIILATIALMFISCGAIVQGMVDDVYTYDIEIGTGMDSDMV